MFRVGPFGAPGSPHGSLYAGLTWYSLRHNLALFRRLYEAGLGHLFRKSLHLIDQIDCTTHR
jgi:hypothetical protein